MLKIFVGTPDEIEQKIQDFIQQNPPVSELFPQTSVNQFETIVVSAEIGIFATTVIFNMAVKSYDNLR